MSKWNPIKVETLINLLDAVMLRKLASDCFTSLHRASCECISEPLVLNQVRKFDEQRKWFVSPSAPNEINWTQWITGADLLDSKLTE